MPSDSFGFSTRVVSRDSAPERTHVRDGRVLRPSTALNPGVLSSRDVEYLHRSRGNQFAQRLLRDAAPPSSGTAAPPRGVVVQRQADLLNPKVWEYRTTDYTSTAASFGFASWTRFSGLGDLDKPVKAYWNALVSFDRKSKVQLLQALTNITTAIGKWRTKYLKSPPNAEIQKAAGLVNDLEFQASEARVAIGAAEFNPLDLIRKSDGIPFRITVHKQPALGPGEAYGLPDFAQPGAATLTAKMLATVLKDAKAPLERDDPNPPAESDLYTLHPDDPNAKLPGVPVKSVAGTIAAPRVVAKRIPNSIYIDNQPSIDDIRQYGFGDCYFLSTLIAVAERDPKRITDRLIEPADDGISVRLWQYESGNDKWHRQSIKVDEKLAYTPGERELVGARFRVGPQPKKSRWYAEVVDGVLSVVREAHFESALWVPLLEKAYAMFIEKFGVYGGQPERTGTPAPAPTMGSGYAAFSAGGQSEQVYYLYYGPDLKDKPRFERITYNTLPLYQNVSILERLLQLQTNDKVPAEHTLMLTVNADKYQQLNKAKSLLGSIAAYSKDQAWKEVGLDEKDTQAFGSLRSAGLSDDSFGKAKEQQSKGDRAGFELFFDSVADATSRFVAARYRPLMEKLRKADPGKFEDIRSRILYSYLSDFLRVCLTITTIRAGGQREGLPKDTDRFLIATHAYTVRRVDFKDMLGETTKGLTVDNLKDRLLDISESESRVVLQNPHRDNTPTGTAALGSPGVFALSLKDFLLGFDIVSSAVVPKTR